VDSIEAMLIEIAKSEDQARQSFNNSNLLNSSPSYNLIMKNDQFSKTELLATNDQKGTNTQACDIIDDSSPIQQIPTIS
jgi:hypothetical protein